MLLRGRSFSVKVSLFVVIGLPSTLKIRRSISSSHRQASMKFAENIHARQRITPFNFKDMVAIILLVTARLEYQMNHQPELY